MDRFRGLLDRFGDFVEGLLEFLLEGGAKPTTLGLSRVLGFGA
jgi:hypothetical protein